VCVTCFSSYTLPCISLPSLYSPLFPFTLFYSQVSTRARVPRWRVNPHISACIVVFTPCSIHTLQFTHRRRATFKRCSVFVGGVRLEVWGVFLVVSVCVLVSGVLFSVGVCVCDLLIFSQHYSRAGAALAGVFPVVNPKPYPHSYLCLYWFHSFPIHTLLFTGVYSRAGAALAG